PRPVRAAADAANPGGADCRGATLRRALGCGASLGLALLLVIAEPFLPATAVFGDPARPPLPSGVGPVPGPSQPKPHAAGGPGSPPNASTVNPSTAIAANFWATGVGADGTIAVYTTNQLDVILDVVGFWSPSNAAGVGNLKLVPPTRVLDTRGDAGGPVGVSAD